MGYIPRAKEKEQPLQSVKGTENNPVPEEKSPDTLPQKDESLPKNYGG